jgi:hypothetical protein
MLSHVQFFVFVNKFWNFILIVLARKPWWRERLSTVDLLESFPFSKGFLFLGSQISPEEVGHWLGSIFLSPPGANVLKLFSSLMKRPKKLEGWSQKSFSTLVKHQRIISILSSDGSTWKVFHHLSRSCPTFESLVRL